MVFNDATALVERNRLEPGSHEAARTHVTYVQLSSLFFKSIIHQFSGPLNFAFALFRHRSWVSDGALKVLISRCHLTMQRIERQSVEAAICCVSPKRTTVWVHSGTVLASGLNEFDLRFWRRAMGSVPAVAAADLHFAM